MTGPWLIVRKRLTGAGHFAERETAPWYEKVGEDYPDADRHRRYSEELVARALGASGSASVVALQRVTHSVPIVFVNVFDPVGAGFVNSMARPGGNTTGFTAFEHSLSGKWLELLKEIAPNLARVAVLREPRWPRGSASSPRSKPWRCHPGWS